MTNESTPTRARRAHPIYKINDPLELKALELLPNGRVWVMGEEGRVSQDFNPSYSGLTLPKLIKYFHYKVFGTLFTHTHAGARAESERRTQNTSWNELSLILHKFAQTATQQSHTAGVSKPIKTLIKHRMKKRDWYKILSVEMNSCCTGTEKFNQEFRIR